MTLSSEEIIAFEQKADEELLEWVKRGHPMLDGVMSCQTLELASQHQAKGVKMTQGWAFTGFDYVCPACQRNKRQIVRLNQHGELMCQLEEHHDHMKDAIRDIFIEEWNRDGKSPDGDVALAFSERAGPVIAAHDNVLVCSDCNGADGKAKLLVGAPKHFTFTPKQIGQFVESRPNTAHVLKEDVVRALWNECRPTFFKRLDLATKIVKIAVTDDHWYEPIPKRNQKRFVFKRATEHALHRHAFRVLNALTGTPKEQEVSRSAWRTDEYKAPRPPSDAQINTVATVLCPKAWNKVGMEWHCSVCDRSKRDSVRLSNKKKWMFSLSSPDFFSQDTKRGRPLFICGDCGDIGRDLGKEAYLAAGFSADDHTTGGYANYVSVDEVRAIIKPQSHIKHNIKNEEVVKLLPQIIRRVGEIEAERKQARATSLTAQLEHLAGSRDT